MQHSSYRRDTHYNTELTLDELCYHLASPKSKGEAQLAGITADDEFGELRPLFVVQLWRASTAQLGLKFAYSTL